MKHLIACCGIDCECCDARIATINNDNELREKIAKEWSVTYSAPQITPDTINCTGCRTEGAKFIYCNACEIRSCVATKGFNTCGECAELDSCPILGAVLPHIPGGKENLLS